MNRLIVLLIVTVGVSQSIATTVLYDDTFETYTEGGASLGFCGYWSNMTSMAGYFTITNCSSIGLDGLAAKAPKPRSRGITYLDLPVIATQMVFVASYDAFGGTTHNHMAGFSSTNIEGWISPFAGFHTDIVTDYWKWEAQDLSSDQTFTRIVIASELSPSEVYHFKVTVNAGACTVRGQVWNKERTLLLFDTNPLNVTPTFLSRLTCFSLGHDYDISDSKFAVDNVKITVSHMPPLSIENAILLRFPTLVDETYTIQKSVDLTNWTNLVTDVVGDDTEKKYFFELENPRTYYRLKPPAD